MGNSTTKKKIEISPLDKMNPPQDFFFKNKNLSKLILDHLEVKDLHQLLVTNKYFYFEILNSNIFQRKFYELLGNKLMVISSQSIHLKDGLDYAKLGLYLSLNKNKITFSSLEDTFYQKRIKNFNVILPPTKIESTNLENVKEDVRIV